MAEIEEKILKFSTLVKNQRAFFALHNTINIDSRIMYLKRLSAAIRCHEGEILYALNSDLGKSKQEGYFSEVSLLLDEIKLNIKWLKVWSKPKSVKSPLWLFPTRSYITHEPLGCVFILVPWNYPFNLSVYPLINAIAAGNCAIIKCSPYSHATNYVIQNIVTEVFPPEYVSMAEDDLELTLPMLKEKFDLIFYTGNGSFAREVMKAAAEHLTPVILELGGKSPCIVDLNTNINIAAKRIVWGKLMNAGQTCVAPDYILVHRSLKNEFINALKSHIISFYGEPAQSSKFYPRIINSRALARLVSYLNDGTVVYGGNHDKVDRYMEPTIMTNIVAGSALDTEEIFGPIFPIYEFDNIDNIIEEINNRPKPLALYYFGDKKRGKYLLKHTTSGGACINDVIIQLANPRLPFGGVGESGIGKYHGWYGYEAFSNVRSYMVSSFKFDNIFRYVPFRFFSVAKKFMGHGW